MLWHILLRLTLVRLKRIRNDLECPIYMLESKNYYQTYREKRNRIIKICCSLYMVVDSCESFPVEPVGFRERDHFISFIQHELNTKPYLHRAEIRLFQRLREANLSIFCVQESRTCINSCEGSLLYLASH